MCSCLLLCYHCVGKIQVIALIILVNIFLLESLNHVKHCHTIGAWNVCMTCDPAKLRCIYQRHHGQWIVHSKCRIVTQLLGGSPPRVHKTTPVWLQTDGQLVLGIVRSKHRIAALDPLYCSLNCFAHLPHSPNCTRWCRVIAAKVQLLLGHMLAWHTASSLSREADRFL